LICPRRNPSVSVVRRKVKTPSKDHQKQ